MRIVSVGEVLWDVFGDEERLGGAPLNFSANVVRLGGTAALLSAVGADRRGAEALEGMRALHLTTEFVQVSSQYATGAAIVVTDSGGNASYRIDRPAAFDDVRVDDALLARLKEVKPDWIYFGTLAMNQAKAERSLFQILDQIPGVKCFYDLNLREGHWNLPLIQRLFRQATILKLNDTEATALSLQTLRSRQFTLEDFCERWSALYGIETIVITLGGEGCAVFSLGKLQTYSGFKVQVADTVGAGDAFSAAFLHGYHLGWPMGRTAQFANAVGATVASRPGATPPWTPEDPLRLIEAYEPRPG